MSITGEWLASKEFVLPDEYKELLPFEQGQATLVVDQYGVMDRVLRISGAPGGMPGASLVKQPRTVDTGPFRYEREQLSALYSGLARDIFIPTGDDLKLMVEQLNTYLQTDRSTERPYYLIVETVDQPATDLYPSGYHRLHGLAALLEIGLTDEGVPFSILMQRNGKRAYQEMNTEWKAQHLYRQ